MAGDSCTCGGRFMDAEDFRDHMPCKGSEVERMYRRAVDDTELRIVRFLRQKAATAVQDIRPADAREMEDVLLLATVLTEAADAIDRGDHNDR